MVYGGTRTPHPLHPGVKLPKEFATEPDDGLTALNCPIEVKQFLAEQMEFFSLSVGTGDMPKEMVISTSMFMEIAQMLATYGTTVGIFRAALGAMDGTHPDDPHPDRTIAFGMLLKHLLTTAAKMADNPADYLPPQTD